MASQNGESSSDPSNPYAREAQIFPRLSAKMAERVAAYGIEELVPADTMVFERGQRGVDFFLVLEGSIEICELDAEGQPNILIIHGEAEFTGELDQFSDRQVLVSGRIAVDTRLVRLKRPDFRRLVSSEPDIGARYRKLDVPDYGRFEGHGVHYAATTMEARLRTGEEEVVVGGGNSAGQAAVFLSQSVVHVHILVRIDSSLKITLHSKSGITALEGDARLRRVSWTNAGATRAVACGNVFVMIGAEPNTDWLAGCLELDAHGFVVTGHASDGRDLGSPFATTTAGVFAVGDVHAGSVKRVASSGLRRASARARS